MKRAIALIVFAAVLLLAGCGHAKDPFVGTWRAQTNDGPIFVISKAHPGYLVVADDDFKGVGVVDGHGDTLTVSFGGTASTPRKDRDDRTDGRPATPACWQQRRWWRARRDRGYSGLCHDDGAVTLVKVSSTTTAPIPAS